MGLVDNVNAQASDLLEAVLTEFSSYEPVIGSLPAGMPPSLEVLDTYALVSGSWRCINSAEIIGQSIPIFTILTETDHLAICPAYFVAMLKNYIEDDDLWYDFFLCSGEIFLLFYALLGGRRKAVVRECISFFCLQSECLQSETEKGSIYLERLDQTPDLSLWLTQSE